MRTEQKGVKMTTCKYCRKRLPEPCHVAGEANRCENASEDVIYQDRPRPKPVK
jgi:hypothetical protein